MPIIEGGKLNFANKKLFIIGYGSPGVGKTTWAQSATNVLTVDTDNGMCRVKPEHRRDTSVCSNFDEVRADIKAARGKYDTIVIDTGGALVEMMKQYVVDHPQDFKGGAKATGGISLQGFGFVKQLWNSFVNDIRKDFNLVIIFHESIENNGDDGKFYQIVVEGSTRTTVWQGADLACRIFISNGQRYAGFTPTEQYSAKSCFGISGLVAIPELKDGDPNDFLTRLFDKVRSNLAAETEQLNPQRDAYTLAMNAGKKIIQFVANPDDVPEAAKKIKELSHALTSEKELKDMLKKRVADLGIVWDKTARVYKYADQ